MAKTKAQKGEIITKLEDAFKKSPSSVFVHFSGLNVADESALRRALREESVRYQVARKTLIRRALTALGMKHEELPLEGEVAVAYGGGEDATLPARLIHKFGEQFSGKLAILGGIYDGDLFSQSQMQEIATIPPVETLRGMFANVINAPIAGLAIALKALAEKKEA